MSILLPLTATSLISTAASVQYQHRHSSIKKRIRKRTPVQYQRQYCSMTYTVPTLEKVKVNVIHHELTLGEKMRFGVFEGEELVYKERFFVRGSQVGANKTATIERLLLACYRGDLVEIEHWWEPDGRIAAKFDYIITNLSTGEMIGRMTKQVSSDEQNISGEVRDEYLALCIKSPRSEFPEENNNGNLKKIPQLKGPADYSQFN